MTVQRLCKCSEAATKERHGGGRGGGSATCRRYRRGRIRHLRNEFLRERVMGRREEKERCSDERTECEMYLVLLEGSIINCQRRRWDSHLFTTGIAYYSGGSKCTVAASVKAPTVKMEYCSGGSLLQ